MESQKHFGEKFKMTHPAPTIKMVELKPDEILANLENIQVSFDEIGIKNSEKNLIFIQMLLIIEQVKNGCTKEHILFNTGELIDFVKNNLEIR